MIAVTLWVVGLFPQCLTSDVIVMIVSRPECEVLNQELPQLHAQLQLEMPAKSPWLALMPSVGLAQSGIHYISIICSWNYTSPWITEELYIPHILSTSHILPLSGHSPAARAERYHYSIISCLTQPSVLEFLIPGTCDHGNISVGWGRNCLKSISRYCNPRIKT